MYTTWPTWGRVLADSNLRLKSTVTMPFFSVMLSMTTVVATLVDRPAAWSTASGPAMSVRSALPRGSLGSTGRRWPGLTNPSLRKNGVKPDGAAGDAPRVTTVARVLVVAA